MLDKSVPYASLYMRREAGIPVVSFPLPEGYNYSLYTDGDESNWARIETSVLEFNSEFAALMRFTETFMPYADELRKRCLFIEDGNGRKTATATAWWQYIDGERRPWLHWVAVEPHNQGLGLGKAIVSRVVELMTELDGEADFYLSTQTWSYKAIEIYKAHGFQPTGEKKLYKERKKDYKKAIRILARQKREK